MNNFKKDYHYSKDLEDIVIGTLLLESDAISRVRGVVEAEHFYYADNKLIFETINRMWEEGMKIDLISVVFQINSEQKQNEFDGNPAYVLTQKTNEVCKAAHLEQHALFLRQMAARRMRMIIQAEANKNVNDDIEKLGEIRDQLNQILTINANDDWHDMSEVMLSVMNHMDEVRGKDMLGIHTGFRELDRMTLGWQPGQLIIVAARPGVGKSAFVSGLALKAAEENKTVGIINLEMPENQVGARLASFYSDVPFWRIYTANMAQNQEEKVSEIMSSMASKSIYISDKANVTVSDIRSKAIKLKKRSGLDMLVIDYLQLIEADANKRDSREREVAKMSRGLKLLAKELGIPVILLCQINRESEKSADKKPHMSHLRESGAIEQDADAVILLFRKYKVGITHDEDGNSTERVGTIIVEKNRNGSIGEIEVGFMPDTMKWHDIEGSGFDGLVPVRETGYEYTDEDPF